MCTTSLPCLLQGRTLPFAPMPTPTTISQHITQWLHSQEQQEAGISRPRVTLCYAQSWDGSLALSPGQSLPLSNRESLQLTHRLRSVHDGILVGIGTVLADDPQLTVRECSGPSPQPIVLDSQLRMPRNARLCQNEGHKCWVLTRAAHGLPTRDDIEIIPLASAPGVPLDLHQVLQALWQRGIRTLMVEGGAQVISGFIRARLADGIVLTVAPTLVGGYKAIDALGYSARAQLPRISALHTERLGDDLIMWGNFHYGDAQT